MITTPKPPNKMVSQFGDNDSRVVQIENEVMDLSLSLSRLQGSQVEFQQEQANTNNQIFDMLNLINSKFDNLVRSSCVEVPSSVPHIPKDINVGERSDCVASLAESLPKWYKFDLSSYDGEADPPPWLCRCEQFFEAQKVAPPNQALFASLHFTGDAQLWFHSY